VQSLKAANSILRIFLERRRRHYPLTIDPFVQQASSSPFFTLIFFFCFFMFIVFLVYFYLCSSLLNDY